MRSFRPCPQVALVMARFESASLVNHKTTLEITQQMTQSLFCTFLFHQEKHGPVALVFKPHQGRPRTAAGVYTRSATTKRSTISNPYLHYSHESGSDVKLTDHRRPCGCSSFFRGSLMSRVASLANIHLRTQAFENTSTNIAAAQMRNRLTQLAETVKDPEQRKASHTACAALHTNQILNVYPSSSRWRWITSSLSSAAT